MFTFGIFIRPADDLANAEFHDRNDPILAELDAGTPGFVERSGYEDEDGPPEWGEFVLPHWYQEKGDGWSPATLSLWLEPEAVAAFAYSGLHGQAARKGGLWFRKGEWPPYVMWWVSDDHRPTWGEGVARHKALFDLGPGRDCFDLKSVHGFDGTPRPLNAARVRSYRTGFRPVILRNDPLAPRQRG